MTFSTVCFGATRYQSGTLTTDKEFTGQRLDGSGLYFYNARYYDATIGRFISADSIIPNYANPQSLNRYTYVLNNPLRYTDPTGHKWYNPVDWGKAAGKTAVDVAEGAAKMAVKAGVAVTDVAIRVSEPVLQKLDPVDNVLTAPAEAIINRTVVPALNLTGAGISNIDLGVTRRYVEVNMNENGWAVETFIKLTSETRKGESIPFSPISFNFIRNSKADYDTRTHEIGHAIQGNILGWPLQWGLYQLADWNYGYWNNPFEKQAEEYGEKYSK